ncbi:MAG: hypothetical protein IKB18_07245 [Tidjanibacter sp.]|nr:hypothetical protein [Tidjanibacter sp.]
MKNIIATLNQLEQSLAQLNPESLSAIELDIALAKLRSIYERLLFVEVAEEQEDVQDSVIELIEDLIEEVEDVPENEEPTVEEEAVEEEPVAEQEPEVDPEPQQEPEPKEEEPVAPKSKLAHKVVLSLYDDDEELPAAPATEEPTVEEPAAEVEPEEEEIPAEEPEESVIELIEELIEEVEDMPEADDEEEPAEEEPETTDPTAEEEFAEPEEEEAPAVEEPAEEECETAPAEEETPVEEEEALVVIDFTQEEPQVVVLGDVLGGEQTTVADAIAVNAGPDVATVAAAGEVSLMKAVSLNDKMLLVRELFGGDSRLYEQSMEVLDSYESLDEAMLFIYDNFDWNPNSEGAKLLVDLLMRKLL